MSKSPRWKHGTEPAHAADPEPSPSPSEPPTTVAQEEPKARRLYPAAPDVKPAAVVVYCSDPRFQVAFGEFIQHELGLGAGEFIPIVVGGGAGVLGHPELLPKEFKFLKERLESYSRIFPTARRIVLINHEDCRYYQQLKSKTLSFLGSRLAPSPEHAREDLSLVARAMQMFLSHLGYTIDFYYAKFTDPGHTRIEIEKVDA